MGSAREQATSGAAAGEERGGQAASRLRLAAERRAQQHRHHRRHPVNRADVDALLLAAECIRETSRAPAPGLRQREVSARTNHR
jgi:hypothetical protein